MLEPFLLLGFAFGGGGATLMTSMPSGRRAERRRPAGPGHPGGGITPGPIPVRPGIPIPAMGGGGGIPGIWRRPPIGGSLGPSGGIFSTGHMVMLMDHSGSTTLSHTEGRMISLPGPIKS